MSTTPPTSLRNPFHFPSFTACPLYANLDLNYYHTKDGTNFQQSRHWCFLGEVLEVGYFLRLRLVVKDITGVQIVVAFYLDDASKQPMGVRVGDTIAVLYANRWGFLDGTVGFRIEDAGKVQIIPRPLDDLLALSDRVQAQMALVDGKRVCHGCGTNEGVRVKCARCGFAWYCGKACQEVGWREKGHKGDCKASKAIEGFFNKDWTNYQFEWKTPL